MPKNPILPLYYNDILGSTQDWTDEEFGAYVRLLIYQWDKGFIPADMSRLNKIADTAEKNWDQLKIKFPPGDDKKLRNPKMEDIRINQEKFKEKQRQNIKKRYQKDTKTLPTNNQTCYESLSKNLPLEIEIEIENENEIDLEEKGGMGEKGEPEKAEKLTAAQKLIVVCLLNIWKEENPNYTFIAEKDEKAALEIAEFIVCGDSPGLSKTKLDETQRDYIAGRWRTWCRYIRGSTKLQNFSLDKINRFYKQEISNALSNPNNGTHKQTTGRDKAAKPGTSEARIAVAKTW